MRTMNMKRWLLILVTFSVALTAAPAAAHPEREEWFWRGHRAARIEHERREHGRWAHRQAQYAYRGPYAARNCYRRAGYRAWDGWRYVWVPAHVVCR